MAAAAAAALEPGSRPKPIFSDSIVGWEEWRLKGGGERGSLAGWMLGFSSPGRSWSHFAALCRILPRFRTLPFLAAPLQKLNQYFSRQCRPSPKLAVSERPVSQPAKPAPSAIS